MVVRTEAIRTVIMAKEAGKAASGKFAAARAWFANRMPRRCSRYKLLEIFPYNLTTPRWRGRNSATGRHAIKATRQAAQRDSSIRTGAVCFRVPR